ncbi:MAG: hypothetical protein QG632_694 [Candidatus Dependentiae bacterium]|nr:hypothetical protein [Candidatus Dependentiae bacterium]
MKKEPISLVVLLKAQKRFLAFSTRLDDEQLQTGAIKAFEYSYELAWKTMKKFVERDLSERVQGSRDAFRGAARLGLIDNPDLWFDFTDERNLCSHAYDDDIAANILSIFPVFTEELQKFIDRAKAHDTRRATTL